MSEQTKRDSSVSLMGTHELKTWPEEFQAMLDGLKPFEVREDDRGYEPGDTLVLKEWHPYLPNPPASGRIRGFGYTGRWATATVRYLVKLDRFGCPGYVAMTIDVTASGDDA